MDDNSKMIEGQMAEAEHNRLKSIAEAERRAAKLAAGPVLIDVTAAMARCFNAGNHGTERVGR